MTLGLLNLYGSAPMANHKSAKKRSIQTKAKQAINSKYTSKIRTSLNKFTIAIKSNKAEEIQKNFSEINSIMAKAAKRGIFRKQYLSRKLSSLSNQIKKK